MISAVSNNRDVASGNARSMNHTSGSYTLVHLALLVDIARTMQCCKYCASCKPNQRLKLEDLTMPLLSLEE